MVTCSYDYLSTDWNHKSFMLYAFIGNFSIPVLTVICFYTSICKAVIMHEAALKAQAKKMNVDSLRSNVSYVLQGKLRTLTIITTKMLICKQVIWDNFWKLQGINALITIFFMVQRNSICLNTTQPFKKLVI